MFVTINHKKYQVYQVLKSADFDLKVGTYHLVNEDAGWATNFHCNKNAEGSFLKKIFSLKQIDESAVCVECIRKVKLKQQKVGLL